MHDNKEVLVEIRELKKYFSVNKGLFKSRQVGTVKAVDNVSISIYKGETLGLIGESGCGKSTLSRVLLNLVKPTGGEIYFKGELITKQNVRKFRRESQMIFQDPYSSLDPRMNVRNIIEEPLRVHTRLNKKKRLEITLSLLEKIGTLEDSLKKYPHEFSGGQRQRIGIARALILNPQFIVCDEPVSALDMSIQAQILNLFRKLQKDFSLTYLFISHDMSVVKHISDRIAVMYLGRIVELAEKETLFSDTLHPYTAALMSAIPIPDPGFKRNRIVLKGDLPSPLNPPPGCPFQTRCPRAFDICRKVSPELIEYRENHFVACHLHVKGKGE